MEQTINKHCSVKSSIVCGQGRPYSTLLIVVDALLLLEEGSDRLRSSIYPHVRRANQYSPIFARVFKHRIIFTKLSKPMPRASDGSIQRERTIELYEAELDRLYNTSGEEERLNLLRSSTLKDYLIQGPLEEEDGSRQYSAAQSLQEVESLRDSMIKGENALQNLVTQLDDDGLQFDLLQFISTNFGYEEISLTTNIFEHGLESFQVMALVNHIKTLLADREEKMVHFTDRMVYDNPNVKALIAAMKSSTSTPGSAQARTDEVEALTKDMTKDFFSQSSKASYGACRPSRFPFDGFLFPIGIIHPESACPQPRNISNLLPG